MTLVTRKILQLLHGTTETFRLRQAFLILHTTFQDRTFGSCIIKNIRIPRRINNPVFRVFYSSSISTITTNEFSESISNNV